MLKKLSKRLLKGAGIVLLFCFSSAVFAEGDYQIDVVIFSHLTPQTVGAEQWPTVADDLTTPALSGQTAQLLPKSDAVLNAQAADLSRQPGFHVVSHIAWREHLTGEEQAFILRDGNLYNSAGTLIAKNLNANTTPINGNIDITLGHYIDMKMNLFLVESTAALKQLDSSGYFNKVTQPTFAFQLKESRRMRSRELDYFWHPVMGVLVKIIPIKETQNTA